MSHLARKGVSLIKAKHWKTLDESNSRLLKRQNIRKTSFPQLVNSVDRYTKTTNVRCKANWKVFSNFRLETVVRLMHAVFEFLTVASKCV